MDGHGCDGDLDVCLLLYLLGPIGPHSEGSYYCLSRPQARNHYRYDREAVEDWASCMGEDHCDERSKGKGSKLGSRPLSQLIKLPTSLKLDLGRLQHMFDFCKDRKLLGGGEERIARE